MGWIFIFYGIKVIPEENTIIQPIKVMSELTTLRWKLFYKIKWKDKPHTNKFYMYNQQTVITRLLKTAYVSSEKRDNSTGDWGEGENRQG